MSVRWEVKYSRDSKGRIFLMLDSARQIADLYGHGDLVREYDTLEMELTTGILSSGELMPGETLTGDDST